MTEPKDLVKNAVLEIGNPLRFEIFFNTINPKIFRIYKPEERLSLLKGLKSLNSLRNQVLHRGFYPNLKDAYTAILSTGKFLRALWIANHPVFSKEITKYDS